MPRLRVTRNSVTGAAVAAVAAGPSYDADATTYFAAVEAADGQALESGVKTAINDFIVGCKADGTWSALKASCLLAGARTLSGALVPLVGTAPTNYNFVSGDYSRTTGLAGNASTKYLDSNRLDNSDPQNSHHLAVYASAIAGSDQSYCGVYTGSNGSFLLRNSSKHYAFSRSAGPVPGAGEASNLRAGLLGGARTGATSMTARFGGTTYTGTISSTARIARNVYIFGRNDSAGFTDATNARLSFYSIGEAVDLALLNVRLTALMSALSTAIPDADALAYIAAVEAADGQALEANVKTAITDFVIGCKQDGNWYSIKASCILAGARTLTGALVPLAGAAPVNYNFVSADYSRKIGLVGNGTSKYIDPLRSGNTDPVTNFHMAVYRTSGTTSTQAILGNDSSDASGSNVLLMYNATFYIRNRMYSASNVFSGNPLNLVGTSRASAASFTYRYSSQGGTVNSGSSASARNQALTVFAGAGIGDFSTQRLSFYSIGEAVDLALLDTRLTTLMSSLATAIP